MRAEIRNYLRHHVDFDMTWLGHIMAGTAENPVLQIGTQQLPVEADLKNYALVSLRQKMQNPETNDDMLERYFNVAQELETTHPSEIRKALQHLDPTDTLKLVHVPAVKLTANSLRPMMITLTQRTTPIEADQVISEEQMTRLTELTAGHQQEKEKEITAIKKLCDTKVQALRQKQAEMVAKIEAEQEKMIGTQARSQRFQQRIAVLKQAKAMIERLPSADALLNETITVLRETQQELPTAISEKLKATHPENRTTDTPGFFGKLAGKTEVTWQDKLTAALRADHNIIDYYANQLQQEIAAANAIYQAEYATFTAKITDAQQQIQTLNSLSSAELTDDQIMATRLQLSQLEEQIRQHTLALSDTPIRLTAATSDKERQLTIAQNILCIYDNIFLRTETTKAQNYCDLHDIKFDLTVIQGELAYLESQCLEPQDHVDNPVDFDKKIAAVRQETQTNIITIEQQTRETIIKIQQRAAQEIAAVEESIATAAYNSRAREQANYQRLLTNMRQLHQALKIHEQDTQSVYDEDATLWAPPPPPAGANTEVSPPPSPTPSTRSMAASESGAAAAASDPGAAGRCFISRAEAEARALPFWAHHSPTHSVADGASAVELQYIGGTNDSATQGSSESGGSTPRVGSRPRSASSTAV